MLAVALITLFVQRTWPSGAGTSRSLALARRRASVVGLLVTRLVETFGRPQVGRHRRDAVADARPTSRAASDRTSDDRADSWSVDTAGRSRPTSRAEPWDTERWTRRRPLSRSSVPPVRATSDHDRLAEFAALDALSTEELRERAFAMAREHCDVGFFWSVLRHLPDADEAAALDGAPNSVGADHRRGRRAVA